MQLRAIYENGKVTFMQPVRLTARRIEVDVIIPDSCIEEDVLAGQRPGSDHKISEVDGRRMPARSSSCQRVSPTRQRLDAILGPWRSHGGASGKEEYKALWHEHLEEKYLARH